MVPLMAALGLGTAGVLVATLFGPAQVASRFINMLFGGRLAADAGSRSLRAALLPLGLCVLLATTPRWPARSSSPSCSGWARA